MAIRTWSTNETTRMRALFWIFTLALIASTVACSETDTKPTEIEEPPAMAPETQVLPVELTPGQRLGPVSLGMSYGDLVAAIGEPDRKTGFRRTSNLTFLAYRLEVVVSTKADLDVTDDSQVISIGTFPGALVQGGVAIGDTEDDARAQFGDPAVVTGNIRYYADAGLAIKVNEEGVIERVSVWPAFSPQAEPPEMVEAGAPEAPVRPDAENTGIRLFEFDGEQYEVVDAHLHTGFIDSQLPEGMAFLVSQIPEAAQLHFPGSTPQVLDPYDPYQGIKAHVLDAGVAHAVILATYTHHTVGYASNRELEEKLVDPRNVSPDGRPWAWGMASVNYDDFEDPETATQRLAALGSYFESYPDLFIGIKLAHAHQAVGFDDPVYLGVYDVAAAHNVPVLLHTGFSPFPNTMTEPEYYDPGTLESVIEAYDGDHGQGRVDFVLSHIGQGDARSIEHSLQLAERYPNVWLELSAINRPLLIDADGQPTEDPKLMHVDVLTAIKERGLIDRLIFATDGPQYFGKVHSYLNLMATTMRDVGYTPDDLRAVLSQNFYRCFNIQ